MPRALYHLEGQQLRGLSDRAATAERVLLEPTRNEEHITQAINAVSIIQNVIADILADGPDSRDEVD